jgi:hypothetical protein
MVITIDRDSLFVTPRNLAAKFATPQDQLLAMLCRIRLKRKSTYTSASASNATINPYQPQRLSAVCCIYSCYIILLSLAISQAMGEVRHLIQVMRHHSHSHNSNHNSNNSSVDAENVLSFNTAAMSTLEALSEFTESIKGQIATPSANTTTVNSASASSTGRQRSASWIRNSSVDRRCRSGGGGGGMSSSGTGSLAYNSASPHDYQVKKMIESCDIALKVSQRYCMYISLANYDFYYHDR